MKKVMLGGDVSKSQNPMQLYLQGRFYDILYKYRSIRAEAE